MEGWQFASLLLFNAMPKKILFLLSLVLSVCSFAQVLYTERFNTLSLNTVTYTTNNTIQAYYFADAPATMATINNGNKIADTLIGNTPFRANGQKQKAWLCYRPVNVADTFAVSTSWLKPTGTADAWLITPVINNIAANTVLTWEAIAPDISNADGYEVYVSTNIATTPNISDFTSANRVFNTAAESNAWVTHGISLAAYAGQSVRIAFRNNSQNKYQLWLDDIIIKNISNSYDVAGISNDTYKYSAVNTNNTIRATFKNNGATPVTNIVLNYQVGNGAVVSETQSLNFPLNYLDSKQITFTQLYSTPTAAYNTVKVWVSLVNGQTDQLNINDTVKIGLTILATIPNKKIFIEEFTSARCATCADSYIRLRDAAITNSNVIVASVHSSDNLTNVSGTALTTAFTTVVPSVVIDRYFYSGTTAWTGIIAQRQSMAVPVEVLVTNVNYNIAARQITATVEAKFLGDVKGDYRLNMLVKENHIYGPINDISDNAWNQYNGFFNVQASPFYQLGIPLSTGSYILRPNDYQHNFVVNEFLDGSNGTGGIIPANGATAMQTYSKTFTYTLPFVFGNEFRFNADNIYLIGVVTENNYSSVVLNAAEIKLTSNAEIPVGLKENLSYAYELNIYPNPATTDVFIRHNIPSSEWLSIAVFNTLGQSMLTKTEFVNAGNVTHKINCADLPEGNYSVVVSFSTGTIHKRLTIVK